MVETSLIQTKDHVGGKEFRIQKRESQLGVGLCIN